MKKLYCNKCKLKNKKSRMKRKQQYLYDPSIWIKTKKKKQVRWKKIKKSPQYKIIFACFCGNKKIIVGKSKSDILRNLPDYRKE